ncbi:hypothetical protein FEM48_Zijuj11G0057300 [Ziziphus jujuba var. spinosa]|uniref:Hydrophobic seed protein domain-containing protein n=1 Tax=Ziziphus jujuba var. spinosa TaxID=714518 RepID=A0A978UH60_ZIZJJ|nr:hypothetical protein FEM48_Zijuj11G0057300 [Ziziphus jujuba var. spinosa]
MGSKTTASLALFLIVNLVFFALVSSCGLRRPCPKPKPNANYTAAASRLSPLANGTCVKSALTFSACGGLLGGLLNITMGNPPTTPCCSLLDGLVDFEAATCLCIALKANIMGFEIPEIPICLALILNACSRNFPIGFHCGD